MPSDESKGSQLDAIGSLAQRQLDNTFANTWWRQWGGARERNVGWRIDYVLASPSAMERLKDAFIWPNERGSDHCPVGVDIDL